MTLTQRVPWEFKRTRAGMVKGLFGRFVVGRESPECVLNLSCYRLTDRRGAYCVARPQYGGGNMCNQRCFGVENQQPRLPVKPGLVAF